MAEPRQPGQHMATGAPPTPTFRTPPPPPPTAGAIPLSAYCSWCAPAYSLATRLDCICTSDCGANLCGGSTTKTAPSARSPHQPISEMRWCELQVLAWSPVYRPPAGTADRVRHDALRDAVSEAERLRGLAGPRWKAATALLEILAKHRVVARIGHPGQQEPPLLTDLMQWAAITIEAETHLLREDTDRLQGALEFARTFVDRLRLARQAVIADGYFTPGQVDDDVAPRITELLAHYRQRLDELAEPTIEWGHQIVTIDGWLGDEVGQVDEAAARTAIRHLNTTLPPWSRAVLIQRDVRFHATPWRRADKEPTQ